MLFNERHDTEAGIWTVSYTHLGFPVNNFGVSGENTYEIVDRSAEYGDQSGDIMIIEMCIRDRLNAL